MEKQLPENWASISLKDVVRSTKGKKPIRLEEFNFDGSLPYMDIKALELNIIKQYADIKSSKLFSKGDVAIVWDGARSGWVSKANAGAIGSTICALTPIKINEDYLYYYLLDQYPFINSKARGVGIPHVDPILLWSLELPLPPLAEQERIAGKLDALFGQLDSVRGAMSRIPTLLANLRQQILTHAITGKLTQEWREKIVLINEYFNINADEHRDYEAIIPDNWCLLSFNDVVTIESNLVNPDDFLDLPLIAPDNIESMTGRLISKPLVSEIAPISPKHYFKSDTLIYSKIRPYLSKIAYVDFEGLCSADMYPLKTQLNIFYLYFYMLSSEFLAFATTAGERSVLPKINQKSLNIIPIPIPPIEEQEEIVSRVQSLFEKLDSIEQRYQMLKTKLENLPQAILHKAFKGELVEQLPTDGNATDLLREIEQLRKSLKKK